MVSVALIISCIANLCSCYVFYSDSKIIKMLRQAVDKRDELIASQRALIDGQLAENEKKIKHLQELQEEKKKRLPKNPQGRECVTSYENIYDNVQVSEDVCALVREFLELNPSTDEQEGRSQELLQQFMRDEQTKNEAIKVIRAFAEWFIPRNTVTFSQLDYWSRSQELLGHLLELKPITFEELAKKSPEEQQRYLIPGKTIVD
ncbi:hypothetical protein [Bartonella sp. B1099]|uniref:hypothetical protein n=1 Tax=Bartonella sp. B1099 TaxID=2911422 RepID=UPI0020C3C22F|nr:hypothetical protein [Bartonella sp. B1099]